VRVRVKNTDFKGHSNVLSLARFYVLHFVGGWIVPLTRLTEGYAKFGLQLGEEYRFCWHLESANELQSAAGGLLLERPNIIEKSRENNLIDASLVQVTPEVASPDEVERLRLGYIYTGRLDMQAWQVGQPGAKA